MEKLVQLVLLLWKGNSTIQKLELYEDGCIHVTYFDSGGNFHPDPSHGGSTVTIQ